VNLKVSWCDTSSNRRKRALIVTEGDGDVGGKKEISTKKPKASHSNLTFKNSWIDCDPPHKGKGGRKALPLLDLLSRYCKPVKPKDGTDAASEHWRCVATELGCTHVTTGPRQRQRVLNHAATECSYLSADLKALANAQMGGVSKSAELKKLKNKEKIAEDVEMELANPAETATRLARLGPQTAAQISQGEKWRNEGRAKRHLEYDVSILSFIVSGGMVPSRVDSPEWKTIWLTVDPLYKPASSSTIVETQLPREAGLVQTELLQFLQKDGNGGFTLSFDGGTTRHVDSVYTVHITTADRRVFLWEGHSTSAESHTGQHLADEMTKVELL
jgi:hypothetical protein